MERRISECLCASLVLVACGTLACLPEGLNNKGVLSLTRAPKLAFKALQFLRILHQLGRYEGNRKPDDPSSPANWLRFFASLEV
eukprot:g26112.t1